MGGPRTGCRFPGGLSPGPHVLLLVFRYQPPPRSTFVLWGWAVLLGSPSEGDVDTLLRCQQQISVQLPRRFSIFNMK